MDRSYTYRRRLVSRERLRKRMAAVAAASLAGAAAVFMLTWKPDPIAAAFPSAFMPPMARSALLGASEPVERGLRHIYPYSVVPGGVASQAELKRIIRTDSVVAAHYATYDAGAARAVVVDTPRAVHVSYRKGDKVYWTAHKVMLVAGETLLTDGRNDMRARCANRISELPQYPVEAHKPAMAELDQALELADGEAYAPGPDGMPVAAGGEAGLGRHPGGRSATRSGSASTGAAATPADSPLAGTLSSRSGGIGPVSTMGLSGAAGSMGSRPWPTGRAGPVPAAAPATPAAPEPVPESDSGSGGSSGSPAPIVDAGTAEPVARPVPGTTTPQPPAETTAPPGSPAAGAGPRTPSPAAPPGTVPEPEPVTQAPAPVPVPPPAPGKAPPPQPAPAAEPVVAKATPEPLPPRPIEEQAPVEVPEPASLWLFGLALAAMCALRRARAS